MTISANPRQYDFGPRAVGLSVSKAFTLTNTGDRPVLVTAVQVGNLAFEVTAAPQLPFVLQPSSHADVTVVFAPTVGSGQVTDRLTIRSDADDVPTLQISLWGRSLDP